MKKKRQIEVKLLEWEERQDFESRGVPIEEIELMKQKKREEMLAKLKFDLEDEYSRKSSHMQKIMKQRETERFKNAFEINESYEEGHAFDVEAQKEQKNKEFQEKLEKEKSDYLEKFQKKMDKKKDKKKTRR